MTIQLSTIGDAHLCVPMRFIVKCRLMISTVHTEVLNTVQLKLEECGNYLLFLWMEGILTDAEHVKAVERFNKKINELKMDTNKWQKNI